MTTEDSRYLVPSDGYRDPQGLHTILATILAVVLTLILCLCFPSCKTLPPSVVPQTHTEHNGHTADNTSKEKDHTIIRDSIIYRWQHDTLLVDRWHTEFRDRWRHDSIHIHDSIHVQDSIPYPVYVDRPVPYKSNYTKFTSWFFWVVVIILLALGAFCICDKIPATKPYTTIIKAFFKFL